MPALAGVAQLSPALPVDASRRRRAAAPMAAVPAQQTLPMYARASVAASAPKWMFIVGGGVLGALVFGLPGAIAGALAGMLLTR